MILSAYVKTPICFQIERHRLRWLGPVKRMEEHRMPKRLLEMEMSGRRPRGRPCTRWIDQAKRNVEQDRMKVDQMQEWADRYSWRLLCKSQPTNVKTT
jgi:hypothetical protein